MKQGLMPAANGLPAICANAPVCQSIEKALMLLTLLFAT